MLQIYRRISVISIKLLCNYFDLLWYSPVNLLHIFRTPFPKNTRRAAPGWAKKRLWKEIHLQFLSQAFPIDQQQTITQNSAEHFSISCLFYNSFWDNLSIHFSAWIIVERFLDIFCPLVCSAFYLKKFSKLIEGIKLKQVI